MKMPGRARRRPWCPRKRILIPFVQLVVDGAVDFRKQDNDRVRDCARRGLCQLCGTPLDPLIVFLGGEIATRQRLFREPPFHEECARFSLTVCPYLRRTDDPINATFCRRFDWLPARFPLPQEDAPHGVEGRAFVAHAIVRVESVGRWAA